MFLSRCKGPSGFTTYQVATLLFLSIVAALPAFAQSHSKPDGGLGVSSAPAPASSASQKTFEVASIRPGRKFFFKGGDFLDPVNKEAPPKGGLFSWNVPVGYMVFFAYDIRSSQLRGGMWKQLPKWAQDESYAVEARADGNPSREDVREMVRSLLAERFKLVVHAGTHDGQVNALTVIKPGLRLKPHVEGAACDQTLTPATGLSSPYPYPSYSNYPVKCGIFDREMGKFQRRIEMVDVTMAQIADTLSGHSPLPVVDSTGLTGHYDAYLDYGPDVLPPDTDLAAEVGSPVSIGLEKQLGLKLVKQNAMIDYFTIDHIEKPSEN